jgi:predicted AlkP superfamily pyrophosphatase or phosphodiesterase
MRIPCFVAILFVASAFNPKTPVEKRNAILISWDGAWREHVRDSLAQGKLENLARLAREGALVDIEVTGHPTDTKAGHAQMLTGYGPEVTGVYSNGKFRPIPLGYSIFERLHQAFGRSGFTTIMLTGKAHNLGSRGPDADTAGEPFFLSRTAITEWDGDRIRPARVVGLRALHHVARHADKGRFFLFIHFADADVSGHVYGEASVEYEHALSECDAWLGKIMAEIESQKIDDRTLIYVSADHGFEKGSKRHGGATHIFLGTNDPKVSRNGEQRDIAPTVLEAMGVDLSKIKPHLPGAALIK